MSTASTPHNRFFSQEPDFTQGSARSKVNLMWQAMRILGSLKITVAMFLLGILILFFGTLAQDENNLAEVKRLYFNSWIAVIPIDVLFPITIFPHTDPYPGKFPMPGGALIGLIMMINLVTAKMTRFAVSAKGKKLYLGSAITAAGAVIVTLVIIAGHAAEGLQGEPPISYDSLWSVLKFGIILLTGAMIWFAIVKQNLPTLARVAIWSGASLLSLTSVLLVMGGESTRLDDPGLRIVWQLVQASVASSVLLVGLWVVFGPRGGNVLIHMGVGLLMVGQFVFGDRQIEQRMSLTEGDTSSMVYRQDELELAIIDVQDDQTDKVTAISESMLRRAFTNKSVIDESQLPCKLRVIEWMPNSSLAKLDPSKTNLATMGVGLEVQAVPKTAAGGAMNDTNVASAYVEIIEKSSDKSLGVVLVSQYFNDQQQMFIGADPDRNEAVQLDSRQCELALRFRREYKPYEVTLVDVRRINYSGSETPRDYSSDVVIKDTGNGSELKGHIWMNNPLRYQGQSFYQSEYHSSELPGRGTVELTSLQVVENAGWIIPYVCCMMVMFGMLAHFGYTFLRFSDRYARGSIPTANDFSVAKKNQPASALATWLPAAASLALVLSISGYYAKPTKVLRDQIDWYAAGKIPMSHEGRIKPLDTVARNILQFISEPVFGSVPSVKDSSDKRHSPTDWLLSLMADKKWPADAPIFRIYAQEARDFFELKPREGFRYSYNELIAQQEKLSAFMEPLQDKKSETFTRAQQKILEVNSKLNTYNLLYYSSQLPPLPNDKEFGDTPEARESFTAELMRLVNTMQRIEAGNPPSVIPPEATQSESGNDPKWQAYGPAIFAGYLRNLLAREKVDPNPALLSFTDILDALRQDDARKFNLAVTDYQTQLAKMPVAAKSTGKISMEAWLNSFNPTAQGVVFYLIAMLLAFLGFLISSDALRRTTFWLLVGALAIHTLTIVSRIYISGRPPVVNLYSSAVFIGWACVLGGLVLERIFPIGVSNLAAAMIGIMTLSIARSLDTSDTMHVLQAVLDTQFWLATHVVTVSLGYASTFLAGFIGIIALCHRMVSRFDSLADNQRTKTMKDTQQILYRMTYGVVCFGIFFSFVGTVLGGLWGDDSWGRFWGWDPKENGALIIVMWNAVVLHARWDKMVGARGFAALAVMGNIVTSWSWFGVNQLGIGLHSYGFTSGVLLTLAVTVIAHIAFIITALALTVPRSAKSTADFSA